MGRSIGCRDYDNSSESLWGLGRFINLKSLTGERKMYELTCFYCVLPEKMTVPGRDNCKQHGIRSGDISNTLGTEQPSKGDHLEIWSYLAGEVDNLQSPDLMDMQRQLADPDAFVPSYEANRYLVKAEIVLQTQQQQASAQQLFQDG